MATEGARMRNHFGLLATAAITLALGQASLAQVALEREGVWPQSYSGRAADPAIRFGQLPNGLRYAILHNATPPGQMSLRLYIGSGSMAEADGQQGLAHFLEHMAFRGSTQVADGEMFKILARRGLAFGAHTNAATSQEATIYQLDFPKAGADDADTGLMLFREIASELTLSKASVDAERGVILSEERARDTPAFRAAKAQFSFLMPGQLASQRWPIGETDVVRRATPEQLRSFYRAEYRPDNAVIVAVGDFDPDAMELKIKQRFDDWKSSPRVPHPPSGAVQAQGEQVKLFVEAGASQGLQISWVRPYDGLADTDAREQRDDIRKIATLIFNHRLRDVAQLPSAPFAAAQLERANALELADVTNLEVVAPADQLPRAIRAAAIEQQRLLRFGVTQAELDRVMDELRADARATASGASTRETPELANAIVKNVNDGDVPRSPAQDVAELEAMAPRIDVKLSTKPFEGCLPDRVRCCSCPRRRRRRAVNKRSRRHSTRPCAMRSSTMARRPASHGRTKLSVPLGAWSSARRSRIWASLSFASPTARL